MFLCSANNYSDFVIILAEIRAKLASILGLSTRQE